MRELELEEISHVSGGCVETTTQPLPDGGTEITGTPCDGDPWVISISMDTIRASGLSVAEYIFGLGGYESFLGDLSENAQNAIDSAQEYLDEANCQQHANSIASAETSVGIHQSIFEHNYADYNMLADGEFGADDAWAIFAGQAQTSSDIGGATILINILAANLENAQANLADAQAAAEADGC